MPTIVARKMESNCHALRVTPDGTGTNQRITPVAIEANSGFNAAPCHGGCDGGVTAAGVDEAAALTVNLRWIFKVLLFEIKGVRLNGLMKLELSDVDFERTGWEKTEFGRDLEDRENDLVREKPRGQEEVSATDAI